MQPPGIRVLLRNESSNATIRGRGGEPRQRNKIDSVSDQSRCPNHVANLSQARSENRSAQNGGRLSRTVSVLNFCPTKNRQKIQTETLPTPQTAFFFPLPNWK